MGMVLRMFLSLVMVGVTAMGAASVFTVPLLISSTPHAFGPALFAAGGGAEYMRSLSWYQLIYSWVYLVPVTMLAMGYRLKMGKGSGPLVYFKTSSRINSVPSTVRYSLRNTLASFWTSRLPITFSATASRSAALSPMSPP